MEIKAATSKQNTVSLELTVHNLSFDKRHLHVPHGALVTLTMHNLDEGSAHNFSLYEDSQSKQRIFKGEVVTGLKDIKYEFSAPDKPGQYFFRCDAHPMANMSGFLFVD